MKSTGKFAFSTQAERRSFRRQECETRFKWLSPSDDDPRVKLASIILCSAWLVAAHAAVGPAVVPLLQTRAQSYTNVSVTGASSNRIFIRHASGLGTLRVEDLGDEARQQLGLPLLPVIQ